MSQSQLTKYTFIQSKPGWGSVGVPLHTNLLDKVASESYIPEELIRVIDTLKPRTEGRYILLNALGAYEYWGSNSNGDAFPEWGLRSQNTPEPVLKALRAAMKSDNWQPPSNDLYGTKTFSQFAKVYRYHENKDPLKASGDVVAAAYNPKMRRSELIVFVKKAAAPDVVDRVDRGEPVAWSMGSRLPFDVCSYCHHISRSRAEYCDHLQSGLGKTASDGRRVFSYNYYPKFFDISDVRVNADKSAWDLKKIASAVTSERQQIPTKKFPVQLPDIDKEAALKQIDDIRKQAAHILSSYRPLPEETLKKLAKFKANEVLSSATSLGILLSGEEITKVAADASEVSSRYIKEAVLNEFRPYVPYRSLFDPYFSTRATQADVRLEKVATAFSDNTSKFVKLIKEGANLSFMKEAFSNYSVRSTLDGESSFLSSLVVNDSLGAAVDGRRGIPFLVALSLLP